MTDYTEYIETKSGKNIVYYLVDWATYARDYQVCDIPIDYVPELVYCFYNLHADGSVVCGDSYADTDKVFSTRCVNPPDTWSDNLPFHGNLGQLLKLKQAGKKFNLSLAVGGWTWSTNFSDAVSSDASRQNFVSTLLELFNKYPIFNGLTIDWEYLSNDGVNYGNGGNHASKNDADNFITFLTLLRQKLNADKKSHYKISIAVTADPTKIKYPAGQIAQLVDQVEIMTYDMADGGFGDVVSSHQSNLYSAPYTPFSTTAAVDAYLAMGVPADKILIGAVLYSRGSANSQGLGKACSGKSPDMSWEQGICDYKTLPRPGATEYWDDVCKASYSYDAAKQIFNSYDTVHSINEKCKYVMDKGLRGIIVWEISADKPIGDSRSLVNALYANLVEGAPAAVPTPPIPAPPAIKPVNPPVQPVNPKPTPSSNVVLTVSCQNIKDLLIQNDTLSLSYTDSANVATELNISMDNVVSIDEQGGILTLTYLSSAAPVPIQPVNPPIQPVNPPIQPVNPPVNPPIQPVNPPVNPPVQPVPVQPVNPPIQPQPDPSIHIISDWNGNDVYYHVGQFVLYHNSKYKCIQAHNSQEGWNPHDVPALWSQL